MLRLLIVEDQSVQREILKIAFEDEYDVKTAADGFKALSLLAVWQPDIIITDQAMPGMTGIELIQKIWEMAGLKPAPTVFHPGRNGGLPLQNNSLIKIILCSGCLTDELVQEAQALGVVACVSKPIDLKELKALVRTVLEIK